MKHYLKKLEETIIKQWDQKALCDYGGDNFSYSHIAECIEQFRLFFTAAGINRGDKIAICAKNSMGNDFLGD